MDMPNIPLLCIIHIFYNLFLVKKISGAWEFSPEFFIRLNGNKSLHVAKNKHTFRSGTCKTQVFLSIHNHKSKQNWTTLFTNKKCNKSSEKNLRTLNIKHTIPYSQYLPTPPQIVILLENISNLKRIPPLIPLRRARVKNKRKKCDTRYTQAEADVDRHGGYIPRFFSPSTRFFTGRFFRRESIYWNSTQAVLAIYLV